MKKMKAFIAAVMAAAMSLSMAACGSSSSSSTAASGSACQHCSSFRRSSVCSCSEGSVQSVLAEHA